MEDLYGMQRIVHDRLRRERAWAAIEAHRRAGRPRRRTLEYLRDQWARARATRPLAWLARRTP